MASRDSYSEPEWRSLPLYERLAFAYTNKMFTDINICVYLGGKEHIFVAHKSILANFSSALEEQIYGISAHSSFIELVGLDPQGLAFVLKKIYHVPPSPRKDIDRSILLSAYHAATTLGMRQLEADIRQEILDQILTLSLVTRDDFWKILELSRILRLDEITNWLLTFAESNGKEVLRAESLAKASPNTLKLVLSLDSLKASEGDILNSVVQWKEGNSTLPFVQEFVEELLGCVRFRNLSLLDFCQFIAKEKDLISNEDTLEIMMHLGNPTLTPLPAWCSTKFRTFRTSCPKDSLANSSNETSNIPSRTTQISFKTTQRGDAGLLNMYTKQKYADVCFLVGSKRKPIRAHRNILALGSTVFEKMFFGPVADSRYDIEVPTLDPEGFEKMLMYFYDDSDPDRMFKKADVAIKTFDAALKYGSVSLKIACLKHCTTDATKPKAFWKQLESKSKLFGKNDKSLKSLLDYAATNTRDVLDCPQFLNATRDAVKCVLQLDSLAVREIDVLNSAVRWLEQNSKFSKSEKSKYELLSLVRFGDLSTDEFCSFMEKHGNVLSKEQSLSIVLHLHNRALPLPDWCHQGPGRTLSYETAPSQREVSFSVSQAMKSILLPMQSFPPKLK